MIEHQGGKGQELGFPPSSQDQEEKGDLLNGVCGEPGNEHVSRMDVAYY